MRAGWGLNSASVERGDNRRNAAVDTDCVPQISVFADESETIRRMAGVFYCGDNLEVLNEYVPDESVDLVYLDPPFNSRRTFNVVYKGSQAQEFAFKDHWSWEEAAPEYARLQESHAIPQRLRTLLRGLKDLLLDDDAELLAYLAMMTPRLASLHRVLKRSGSLYLHCDPTASHYLKIILDSIFGTASFRNEIIWKRSSAHSDAKQGAKHFGRISDTLLFYSKSSECTFNHLYGPYDPQYVAQNYKRKDPDGRVYRIDNIQGPGGAAKGNPEYEFLGVTRYWRYSKKRMRELYEEGRIIQTRPGAVPQYKRYLDEMPGVPLQNVWTDIPVINNRSKERLPYPTQKPLALMERILLASSNVGDLVLDPFCGCGTTIEASERLGRRWIGVDVAAKAVEITEERFERSELMVPEVIWHPVDMDAASALAKRAPRQFEAWALRKVRAARRRKKDRGIDGEAMFREQNGRSHHVIVSVKGGRSLNPGMVRDLRGTVERESSAIGIFLTLHEPTKEMRREASRAGFLSESDAEGPIPRIQIVTIERVFSNLPSIRCPGRNLTQLPARVVPERTEQLALLESQPPAPRKKKAKASKAGKNRVTITAAATATEAGVAEQPLQLPGTRKGRPGSAGPRVATAKERDTERSTRSSRKK